jgi:hypothetical protein
MGRYLPGRAHEKLSADARDAPSERSDRSVVTDLAEADLLVEMLPVDEGHSLEAGIEQAVVG